MKYFLIKFFSSVTAPSLPASLMSSLTQANLNMTARKRHQLKPESQAGMYLNDRSVGLGSGSSSGSGRVPHPYHAYNSAYNPVSRQDSELQSLSSDAHTTDDNMSSFTDTSSHFSNHYRSVQTIIFIIFFIIIINIIKIITIIKIIKNFFIIIIISNLHWVTCVLFDLFCLN